ncbi:hypothetical protein Dimus_031774 [Dionaea muscipula]
MTLRSAPPPPPRKKPSPPSTEEGGEIAESSALITRKRTPASQSPMAMAEGDDEIIDLTIGKERENVADGATSKTAQQGDEEDVASGGVQGVVPPPKKKRKLTKGTVAGADEKGKDGSDSMAVRIVAKVPEAEKEDGKKGKAKGKVEDAKLGKNVVPLSLQLSPSLQPIMPASAGPVVT